MKQVRNNVVSSNASATILIVKSLFQGLNRSGAGRQKVLQCKLRNSWCIWHFGKRSIKIYCGKGPRVLRLFFSLVCLFCFHVSLTPLRKHLLSRRGYGNTGTVSCSMGVINCLVRQQFIYTRLLLVICGPCCHKSRSLALQMSAALSFAGLHSIINIKTQRSS